MPTHQSESADNVTMELGELPVNLFINTATNHHLPNYIQNMPLAYGYDRLEFMAQMDVNIDSGQPIDIDKMLQYVQQNWSLGAFSYFKNMTGERQNSKRNYLLYFL